MTTLIVTTCFVLGTLLNEAAVFWSVGDMQYWSQKPFLPFSLKLWLVLVPLSGLLGVIAARRPEYPLPRKIEAVLKLFRAAALPPLAYSLFFFCLPFAAPAIILLAGVLVFTQVWLFVSAIRSWYSRPNVFGICTMISFAAGSAAGLLHVVVMSLSDP